jgi:hypothetical protein
MLIINVVKLYYKLNNSSMIKSDKGDLELLINKQKKHINKYFI